MPLHPPAWTVEFDRPEKDRLIEYLQSLGLWRAFRKVQKARMDELQAIDPAYAERRDYQSWHETWEAFTERIQAADEDMTTARVEESKEASTPDGDEESVIAETVFDRFVSQKADIQADVEEAYQKVPQPGLCAEDFERGGAWEMYRLARKNDANRKVFVYDFAAKYLDKVQKAEEAAGKGEGSDKLLELNDTLQADMEAGKARTVKCPSCGTEVPCP
ncbi:hypothetical protein LCGC14_2672470, partial [marine sediment metagenome]